MNAPYYSMIENIPTSDDFKEQGIWFLNLAWAAVFDLISDFGHFVDYMGSDHDYYKRCLEDCDSNTDPKFVEFCKEASKDKKSVEEIRNRYWKAAFDDRLEFSENKIVTYILDIANICVPKQWPQLRQKYFETHPGVQEICIGSNRLCDEMDMMIKLLGQKKLIELFGFDKKQRRYICPSCFWALEQDYNPGYPLTAQLTPSESDSTTVYCFVCGENSTVNRKECQGDSCKGNVIDMLNLLFRTR